MNLKEQIASRITQARKAKGITIKELSARTKTLSPARISNWEQGTRRPGAEEAILLSKQLDVAVGWLFCATDNPKGEWLEHTHDGMRYIPVLSMQDAPHINDILKRDANSVIAVDSSNPSIQSKTLFAIKVEDNSMQPDFNPGAVVVIDGECSPKPGDYVLAYLASKNQTVLRKYREVEGCLFQLLASNDLWAIFNCKTEQEADILGVITESRLINH